MDRRFTGRLILSGLLGCAGLLCTAVVDEVNASGKQNSVLFGPARMVGRLGHAQLVECSGLEASLTDKDLLWAINDGGQGAYLYALNRDGRNRGRVRVAGARNRDWEGLDTFFWEGRPMMLIADIGDNEQVQGHHTLYVVPEPIPTGDHFGHAAAVAVAWRIVFAYPDRPHDAEGVAVDAATGKVFVLTKRDAPPLLFELPLWPPAPDRPIAARQVAAVSEIPRPSAEDLTHKYGKYRSWPTALDFSPDGSGAVVLTYKHAYLFRRGNLMPWGTALGGTPAVIPLPLPQAHPCLRQREAICYAPGRSSLLVTSEGRGACIYLLEAK